MRPRLALSALLAPAAVALAACNPSTPAAPIAAAVAADSTSVLTGDATGDGLTITGLRADHGAKGLMGRVENRADVPFDSLHVWISLLGADRDSLDAVELTRDSLGAASAWHFTRPYAPDSVAFIRIDRYAGTRRGSERTDAVVRGVVPAPRMGR